MRPVGPSKPETPEPAGARSYARELWFASLIALAAAGAAAQSISGYIGGHDKSVTSGAQYLLFIACVAGVWLWGYWARASRRKLALEAKFRAEVEAMRAELTAQLAETAEGVDRVANLLAPESDRLAVVLDFPTQ